MQAMTLAFATSGGGFLLVLSLVVPLTGILLAFAAGGRQVERIALGAMPLGFVITLAIVVVQRDAGASLVYHIGGWAPPLGLALRADGLSVIMMAITAVVICAIGVFARTDFRTPAGSVESRAPFAFWILLLAVWAALNTIFLGGDLFTLYVALELLTFAAVPLVCLDGRAETLQAALRYLLFALLGSALYLAGTALFYGTYGTLDIALLSHRLHPEPTILAAAALMTVGLLAKTAVFPLHLWLPPAHAGAPAAASAVLSALVVKGSFFIVVRLWFGVVPRLTGPAAMELLAALGAGAIVFGSVVALRQKRLKLLVAYSTLAQIGYLFLMFPLAFNPATGQLQTGDALMGGMLQAISHASAKAAMFMAAGLVYAALGHDRIAGLSGIGRALPISLVAFAVAGVSLIGVPPSGAYQAKELLLRAAAETDQWWWAIVIQVGGIFTSSYVLLVIVHALAPAARPLTLRGPVPRYQEAAALALALFSALLGLLPWPLDISFAQRTPWDLLTLTAFSTSLWPILSGALVAILLGRWGLQLTRVPSGKALLAMVRPFRRVALVVGMAIERTDRLFRRWPVACLSLLALVVLFGAALLADR